MTSDLITNSGATLDATSLGGASVSQRPLLRESVFARGVYKGHMTGPLEHLRSEYIDLRDKIAAEEARGLIHRILGRVRLDSMRDELAKIPMETKWIGVAPNLVTTVGGNHLLDTYLAGSSYSAAWYIGLISSVGYTTGPVLGDTMASHTGWTEDLTYSNTNRGTTAWSSAASKSKSLSAGIDFNMTGNATIKGCFLVNNNTKNGTTGLLFSAGLFDGGDQPVVNGNTLTVTYTASV